MKRQVLYGVVLASLSWLCGANARAQVPAAEADYSAELPRIKPLSVEEAMQSFQTQPGFRIELVAAEPLVKDPVAFAFSSEGYLFVVEMCDYSEQETEHLGSIARLEDTDGDGRMDKRTTYATGLSWPTAVWPWKNGVVVAEPPNLLWLGDTDGDGQSDQRQVWYEGFGRSNVQGLVNSLRWSVDGYIHGATSSSGADLKGGQTTADSDKAIALRGRDFAIDPLKQHLEPTSGGGQHGMWFNRWGDKFVTSNSDHLQQIIDLDHWLGQHSSNVPMPSLRRSIAEDGPQAEVYRASPVEPWRIVRTRLRVSGAVPGVVEGGGRAAGYFTGATATCIMDHEAGFGDADLDTAIVCDVGSNLVHRKRMLNKGLFWSGQRIDKESELLRSSDIWFRPVQLGDGPDGALYIADMYREVIEHPKSLPPVIKKHLDLTSGRDRGRIWRLIPEKSEVVTKAGKAPLPGRLSNVELVKHLHHPIAWQRRAASQLLLERNARDVKTQLIEAALNGQLPEGRLLALHLLNRLEQLDNKTLEGGLRDQHPRVQAAALTLTTTRDASALADAISQVKTGDAQVELAAAMAAERLPIAVKAKVLGNVLASTQEPLVRAICLVSAGNDSPALFSQNLSQQAVGEMLRLVLPAWSARLRTDSANDADKAFAAAVTQLVSTKLAAGQPDRTAWISALASLPSRGQADALIGLLTPTGREELMQTLRKETAKPTTASTSSLAWARLLPTQEVTALSKELLTPNATESQQLAISESLLWNDPNAAIEVILPELPRMTPVLKRQVLGSIMRYSQLLEKVADAVEKKSISRAEIAPDVRQQLFAVPNKKLAERFKALLSAASADRAKVIDKYRPELAKIAIDSDQEKTAGRMVFQKVCAQCHKLQDIGNDVGPPLKQLADKSPEQLLEIILDPNREVDPKYLGYTVLLSDNRVLTGIIREESAGQLVLAETGGKVHTISRSDIEQLKTTGLSLMPNGLEEQINAQQMTQLIAYLKGANQTK